MHEPWAHCSRNDDPVDPGTPSALSGAALALSAAVPVPGPADAPERDNGTTATDRVYDAVYRAVMEHRLTPGQRLREAELAAELGVSRTVVRQALQRLAQVHVIELMHNRGARVALPSLEDAAYVFEARRMVECEVARKLGGELSGAQVQELQQLAQAEAEADCRDDRAEAIRLSGEFHTVLVRMYGNPVYQRLLTGLMPTTSLLMARFKLHGGQVCVAHRHTDLITALIKGSGAAATEMRKHLVELEQSLVKPPSEPRRRLRDAFASYRDTDPLSSSET